MSREQRHTLQEKLRRVHQLFSEGISEKDAVRRRKLLHYFREKELPILSQQIETLMIESERWILFHSEGILLLETAARRDPRR